MIRAAATGNKQQLKQRRNRTFKSRGYQRTGDNTT